MSCVSREGRAVSSKPPNTLHHAERVPARSAIAPYLLVMLTLAAPVFAQSPVVVTTWKFGLRANEAAWPVLESGGRALDAVETGVRLIEADPRNGTVGIGGAPDESGVVTLDACIMDEHGDCGSVAAVQNILHPVSLARRVMEDTRHVMLVGEGAERFAYEIGFPRTNLLTDKARERWEKWRAKNERGGKAEINVENHDTIGMLALDRHGNLSGACSTSGAAFKMPGRVGDSPLIGAGLFVDNDVGAACATGWGEAVIRVAGTHLVVEFMRQGHSPAEACRLAIERVIAKNPDHDEIQVCFIALNKAGEFGAASIKRGFNFAVHDSTAAGNRMEPSLHLR